MSEEAGGFVRSWQAEVLAARPEILPTRSYVYPREAEEVERGALEVMVRPAAGASFLATCALGFRDPLAPSGLWAAPHPDWLCALAGGYAYLIDTLHPERFWHLDMRPVLEVRALAGQGLLLFAGHARIAAWERAGPGLAECWRSERLSWEGLRMDAVTGGSLCGSGWDLASDSEVPFRLDLRTGRRVEEDGGPG